MVAELNHIRHIVTLPFYEDHKRPTGMTESNELPRVVSAHKLQLMFTKRIEFSYFLDLLPTTPRKYARVTCSKVTRIRICWFPIEKSLYTELYGPFTLRLHCSKYAMLGLFEQV